VTRPVGVSAQPDFVNQVLCLESARLLTPGDWLGACQEAERATGRRPTYHWGPRRADVDLLLLGRHGEVEVSTSSLVVPHPRLGDRPFLCALLAELDPRLRHPQGWLMADRAGRFAAEPW
jgi:2-amino-4-hydroxy-6-hydroxymethyldihydropteridine diphosphokinase